jgi:hypothetical protein
MRGSVPALNSAICRYPRLCAAVAASCLADHKRKGLQEMEIGPMKRKRGILRIAKATHFVVVLA